MRRGGAVAGSARDRLGPGIVRVTEEEKGRYLLAARWPGLPVPFPALVHVPLPLGERQIKILLPVTLQMRLLVGGQRRKEEKKE